MPAPIDFYFDFSSPYGYLASTKVDDLAAKHGREAAWHPILLGVVFKTTGGAPLPSLPVKGPYSVRDFARSAKYHGVEFRLPEKFPVPTQAAARAVVWLQQTAPARAKEFAKACYRAYFVDGQDISAPDTVMAIGERLGITPDELSAAINDPGVKEQLKRENEAALAAGVFGSPFIVVDGEPFWGVDRLEQVDRWLATGGW
jgi:2-hydroxychromene-2-carboxylate isomerase